MFHACCNHWLQLLGIWWLLNCPILLRSLKGICYFRLLQNSIGMLAECFTCWFPLSSYHLHCIISVKKSWCINPQCMTSIPTIFQGPSQGRSFILLTGLRYLFHLHLILFCIGNCNILHQSSSLVSDKKSRTQYGKWLSSRWMDWSFHKIIGSRWQAYMSVGCLIYGQ